MTKTLTFKAQERALAIAGLAALLAFAPETAIAAPLEPVACATLSTERANLVADGVETDMAKGAAWARQSLPQDRLLLIKRLIEVNEQLSFRCGIMVTERPTLIQSTPPATQALASPGSEDGQQKKQTKSKPKPAAGQAPAGLPGSKPKPPAKAADVTPSKQVTEAKNTPAPKAPPAEKAGN